MSENTGKIIIANWHKAEEIRGGQETYFYELAKLLNAKRISYLSCENVLRINLFENEIRPPIYQGYVIAEYLKQYEKMFSLDLIIKNAGIGAFTNLKTKQIIVFQDPFYSIQKFLMDNGVFLGDFWRYNANIEMQRRTAKQGKTTAVSNFMKEDMKLNDIKCDKVIEEGVDTEKFKPIEKEELRKVHNLPLDKKIGIAVTKFLLQKGYSILVKLIHKFPEIHWIIVLSDSVGIKPKLKNVTLIEEADPLIMPRIYNCADFFINTSPVESFGLSACEAASCNLPIIIYKTGWAWDWWDKRLGIRVDNWINEDFENAVKNLWATSYEPRKAIIERGFTKERMAKDWKEFTEKIIKNK